MGSQPVFDFLVIGGQKCGSTWAHFLLDQHPDIFVPGIKEVHYFNNLPNYSQGPDWYRSVLTPETPTKLRGECTPNYFWNQILPGEYKSDNHIIDIAPKVRALNPDAKLILILRDPIDRAISAYHHHITKGRMRPRDGMSANLLRFGILSMGLYAQSMKHWLAHFDRSQFLILNFERDIKGDKSQTVKRVFDFLGVGTPDGLEYEEPRNERSTYFSMHMSNYVPKAGFPVVKALRKISAKLITPELDARFKPSITHADLAVLRRCYQPEIAELDALIGEDFGSWWTKTGVTVPDAIEEREAIAA